MVLQLTEAELNWLEIILSGRFGHKFSLRRFRNEIKMTLQGHLGAIVFDQPCRDFRSTKVGSWSPENEGWLSSIASSLPTPGLRSVPCPLIDKIKDCHFVHYNIIELTYWMLARVEELENGPKDNHGRFSGAVSHAYRSGYLERPIIDEWLYVLRQVISRQWPAIALRVHTPTTKVSCDVDSPFEHLTTLKYFLRTSCGDLIKRKSLVDMFHRIKGRFYYNFGVHNLDKDYNGIKYIMNVNETIGSTVTFNFIPLLTNRKFDGFYDLNDMRLRKLMQQIAERGHVIGIHPGYDSFNNRSSMKKSFRRFRQVLDEINLKQDYLTSRQHYLRWNSNDTPLLLNDNGTDYDSTLGYADMPGFRCGTCFEFPMFDVKRQKLLTVIQQPLIVMECSVISTLYLGLGYTDTSLQKMISLKEKCYKVGGQFTVLWHNSHFRNEFDKQFYETLLKS